ncbi:MAG: hypothetical protein K0S34_346 [Bacillales bacterium]|jgi:hypothetical protein|nr:hypothetical protein [Bacillales bacterium]
MEMIERYVYAVTHRLPQSQREEIARELRGLIEDMLDERVGPGERTIMDVESVLLELGDPDSLSEQYGGSKRFLIGPYLYNKYLSILKIVLMALAIAMSVVLGIEIIAEPSSIYNHFVRFISLVINSSTQAFAWITIGFAIAEYKGARPKAENQRKWHPSDLPAIPNNQKQIKRGEAITGIIFSILFLVFIIFANHLVGFYVFKDNKLDLVIPFFNSDVLSKYMPIIYIIIVAGILKEGLKLVIGKWTKKLAIYNLLINVVTLALVTFIFSNDAVWNPNFMRDLAEYSKISSQHESYQTIKTIWENSRVSVVTIYILILIVDTVSVFFKSFKN